MSRQTPEVPAGTNTKRAGVALRVWGCVLALVAFGLGSVGLFGLPDNCRLIGYLAAVVFIPGVVWVLFVSLRGRSSDLQGFVGNAASNAAGAGAAGRVMDEIIDKLT